MNTKEITTFDKAMQPTFESDTSSMITMEATTRWERITEYLSDVFTLRLFDRGISYTSNIPTDLRNAKYVINRELTDNYFNTNKDEVYALPFGLNTNISETVNILVHLDKIMDEYHDVIKEFKEYAGKFVSSEEFRNTPFTLKRKRLDNITHHYTALKETLDSTGEKSEVTLLELLGNAKTASSTVTTLDKVLYKVTQKRIDALAKDVNSLSNYTTAIIDTVAGADYDEKLSIQLETYIKDIADTTTELGKMIFTAYELAKILIILADDITENTN